MKSRDRSRRYMCVGENFKDNAPIGDCGDTKSLMDWLIHLSHRDEDELKAYFDRSFTNNDAVDYISRSWGKKLQEVP